MQLFSSSCQLATLFYLYAQVQRSVVLCYYCTVALVLALYAAISRGTDAYMVTALWLRKHMYLCYLESSHMSTCTLGTLLVLSDLKARIVCT
jgi:hypothetical protein